MGIGLAFLGISIVIFVHELGHMLLARRAGIGVYEFAIGMGPKLLSKKINDTEYSLRIFPLGGFVRLAGLEDEDEAPDHLSFYKKSRFARFLTLVAGVAMNIVFGFILYVIIFGTYGVTTISNTIDRVLPDMPAAAVGIIAKDKIVQIDDKPVIDATTDLLDVIKTYPNETMTLVIERDGQRLTKTLTPKTLENGTKIIGFYPGATQVDASALTAITQAARMTAFQAKQVFVSVHMLITGSANLKQLAGPIGIIQMAGAKATTNFVDFLNLMALISVSLGVLNILPFPVLDGGHILLLGIEAIRNKRLNKKTEERIQQAGAAVLIGLMAIVVFNDVVNWKVRADLLNPE